MYVPMCMGLCMYVCIYVCMEVGTKSCLLFFLRKYKYICNQFYAYYVDILYKFQIIFLQSLHYQHTLPSLRETQFAGRAELLADASGLFTHTMLHRLIIH